MTVLNSLGYPVFSDSIMKKIFDVNFVREESHPIRIEAIKTKLTNLGIDHSNVLELSPPTATNFTESSDGFPTILGSDIQEHFELMAKELNGDTTQRIDQFLKSSNLSKTLKFAPKVALQKNSGWTRYNSITLEVTRCEVPEENVLVFDTETFVKGSDMSHPVLATAISETSLYVWMHDTWIDPYQEYVPVLVPIGSGKVLIAHNAAYDYSRCLESFDLFSSHNVWIDTLSLHNILNGKCSSQTFYFSSKSPSKFVPEWSKMTSNGNLVDCYNFHVKPSKKLTEADKKVRKVFVDINSMTDLAYWDIGNGEEDVRPALENYAILDVVYTTELFDAQWFKYKTEVKSEVMLAANNLLINAVTPVSSDWNDFLSHCDSLWKQALDQQASIFKSIADKIVDEFLEGFLDPSDDTYYKELDWTIDERTTKTTVKYYQCSLDDDVKVIEIHKGQKITEEIHSLWGVVKGIKKKLIETKETISPKCPETYGLPKWYYKTDWSEITSKSRIAHTLLRLKWKDSEIYYVTDKGWCYKDESLVETKVPHPSGDPEKNTSIMFNSEFVRAFKKGILSSDSYPEQLEEIMGLASRVSYWTGFRKRAQTMEVQNINGQNVWAASICPYNTVSGRTGNNSILTFTDYSKGDNHEKIGTEVKNMCVMSVPGYSLVHSDLDSVEAVLASIWSESIEGIVGSTGWSYTSTVGSKETETDIHTLMAKFCGIERDDAKTCVYGVVYGMGIKKLTQTLMSVSPNLTESAAKSLGNKFLGRLKGQKTGNNFLYGYLSEYFNYMKDFIEQQVPTKIILGAKFPPALRPKYCGDEFTTTRGNLITQSAGSDMLRALIVAVDYLIKKNHIDARLCVTIHDAVIYLCKNGQEEKLSAVMQLAHLWTYSLVHFNAGIKELPISRCFFASVEQDLTLRKKVNKQVKTFSTELDLPNGISRTIMEVFDYFKHIVV